VHKQHQRQLIDKKTWYGDLKFKDFQGRVLRRYSTLRISSSVSLLKLHFFGKLACVGEEGVSGDL